LRGEFALTVTLPGVWSLSLIAVTNQDPYVRTAGRPYCSVKFGVGSDGDDLLNSQPKFETVEGVCDP